MEGFQKPVYTNFITDRVSEHWWNRREGNLVWQCTKCGTPGITDRTLHNQESNCAPIAWLDPLGVLAVTTYYLWGEGKNGDDDSDLP